MVPIHILIKLRNIDTHVHVRLQLVTTTNYCYTSSYSVNLSTGVYDTRPNANTNTLTLIITTISVLCLSRLSNPEYKPPNTKAKKAIKVSYSIIDLILPKVQNDQHLTISILRFVTKTLERRNLAYPINRICYVYRFYNFHAFSPQY
jgi:uncharacterized membrane protein